MIMMGRKKKGGILALIMKSMNNHDSLKNKNAENYEKMEQASKEDSEQDNSQGLDVEASKMIEALKSNDVSSFKSSLRSFIKMAIND